MTNLTKPVAFGLVLGTALGAWILVNTAVAPLAEDTGFAVGAMFGIVFLALAVPGFAARRRVDTWRRPGSRGNRRRDHVRAVPPPRDPSRQPVPGYDPQPLRLAEPRCGLRPERLPEPARVCQLRLRETDRCLADRWRRSRGDQRLTRRRPRGLRPPVFLNRRRSRPRSRQASRCRCKSGIRTVIRQGDPSSLLLAALSKIHTMGAGIRFAHPPGGRCDEISSRGCNGGRACRVDGLQQQHDLSRPTNSGSRARRASALGCGRVRSPPPAAARSVQAIPDRRSRFRWP